MLPGTIYGRLDVELHENHSKEVKRIITQLPSNFDAVFCSPATRCKILANAISAKAKTDPRIQELNFGLWEGKNWDEINRSESQLWMEDFVNRSPPEGETLLEMNARVMEFWNELQTGAYQNVAVVTHAGVIRLIVSHLNQTPLSSLFDLQVAYGEIFKLSIAL